MKVDFYFPSGTPLSARSAARRAANLGFDGFFTAETSHDPFFPLLIAADETELDLGTAIAVAFPRSPMITAQIAWDLAAESSGRFILGLGTQVKAHITRRFSTEWGKPVARLRDYIASLRAIWDAWQNQTRLRHEGEFYRFTLMTPFFDPGPIPHPQIPISIAGVGPQLSRLAGAVCDGFHVHPFHTVRYLDEVVLPNIASGAEAEGRALDDCERYSTVLVVTGHDDSEVEQSMAMVKRQISFYASTPSYAPVLEANGWDFGPKLTAMSKRGEWEEMATVITDEVVEEVGVVAPIDRLGTAISERYGNRIQRVGLYNLGNLVSLDDDGLSQVLADIKKG